MHTYVRLRQRFFVIKIGANENVIALLRGCHVSPLAVICNHDTLLFLSLDGSVAYSIIKCVCLQCNDGKNSQYRKYSRVSLFIIGHSLYFAV